MGALWALFFGVLYFIIHKRNLRAATVLSAVVLSHWFLDALVHRPDLPLTPGGEARIGLGLWNSVPATLALEGALFVAALAFYLRSTRATDRIGSAGFWALVAFLLVAYCAAAFGLPPPSVETVAWAGIAGGVVTALWGYWVDRHREVAR
jgi:hypothetical protein